MQNKQFFLLIDLSSGFFLNLSGGYFFAIYAAPDLLNKVNALIACCACFSASYYIAKQK